MHVLQVQLVSDLYERVCDHRWRPPLDAKRKRWIKAIRRAGVLFIHVPKTAGMSINRALYGEHVTHSTMRYYARVAPDLVEELPSFAVVRDPVERFLSAYDYARAGGGADNVVSEPFHAHYRDFRSIDDALDHLEAAADVYAIDHIFRPQRWFLTDEDERMAVGTLVPFPELPRLGHYVPAVGTLDLPHLNRTPRRRAEPTARQKERLQRFYADDFALMVEAQRQAAA